MSIGYAAFTVRWSVSTGSVTGGIACAGVGITAVSGVSIVTSAGTVELTGGVVDTVCAVGGFGASAAIARWVAVSHVASTVGVTVSSCAGTGTWVASWSDGVLNTSIAVVRLRARATLASRMASTLVGLAVDTSPGFITYALTVVVTMSMSGTGNTVLSVGSRAV